MGDTVRFSCTCGTVTGRLADIGPKTGSHVVCFCGDCRSAEVFLGQPDPAPGPVAYFQLTPDRVTIDSGADNLGALKLYRKSRLLRWHATCCGAPLFNTMDVPGVSFASFVMARTSGAFDWGPVDCQGFIEKPNGKIGHQGMGRVVWAFIKRVAAARLSGRWRQTPFFRFPSKEPVAAVRVLTAEDRAGLPLRRGAKQNPKNS